MTLLVALLAALYFAYERHSLNDYRSELRKEVSSSILTIKERMSSSLKNRLFLAHSIESYVHATESITEESFTHLASSLMLSTGNDALRSVQIARGTTVEYAYPREGNEAIVGQDLMELPGQGETLRRTIAAENMVLAGPLELVQGGLAVVARKPIYTGEGAAKQFWGLATVIIDWENLLQESTITAHPEMELALVGKDAQGLDGALFFGERSVLEAQPVTKTVKVPGGGWVIAAIPNGGWPEVLPGQTFQRTLALLIGILLLLGAWFAVHYPLILHRRVQDTTRELEQGKAALERRVEERTAALAESEQRMRRLIDMLPFPVTVTPVKGGTHLYANEPAADLFEVNLAEGGPNVLSYYADPTQREEIISLLKRDGKVLGYEILLKGKRGKQFWGLISSVPIAYDGQEAILTAVTDISERKKMEIALSERERTLRAIFESVQTPMAIARTSDGLVLLVNEAGKRMAGISQADLGRVRAQDLYCDIEDRQALLAKLERDGFVKDMEICMLSLTGERLTMLASLTYIDYNNELCVIASYTEITERKKIEQALQKANAEAKQAIKSKNEFLATMSHEIRTPLNGALTMLQLLSRTPLTPEQREYVEAINYSGESLQTILNDVLDLSKLEAGMLELEDTGFNIYRMLDDMEWMMKPSVEKSQVELHHRIDARIPQQLRGDPTRIRQVLFNLLGNAIKFTEVGEVELRVDLLSESKRGVMLEFRVRDTGIGIPKRLQARLFESFTQADSSVARHYGGTGLGLAICRRMVESMGGVIGVVSEEGTGSEFWFRLMLQRAVDSDTQTKSTAKLKQLPPLKVLLVEDDAINRRAGSMLLRQEGLEVVTAVDGYEALERFRDGGFDVVLMDVRMPGMDGLETTRRLRELKGAERVAVLALTADVTQDNIDRCLASGMCGVITKPIHIDRLREVLATLQRDDAAVS